MIFSFGKQHIFKTFLPVALVAFFLTQCSDAFLQPQKQPSEVKLEPGSVEVFEGEKIDFNLEIVDGTGNPFKAVPGWVDTLYSFPEADITLNKDSTFLQRVEPEQQN